VKKRIGLFKYFLKRVFSSDKISKKRYSSNSNMDTRTARMFAKKNIVFTGLMLSIFIYGIAIGRYQVFPYQQLSFIQGLITGTDIDAGAQNYDGVEVIETSLQRLLLKEVPVDEDYSPELYRTGGALAPLDSVVYISSNRNDREKEQLILFNSETFRRIEAEGMSVPMNYDEFLNSSRQRGKDLALHLFRVDNIYAEKTGRNEHTLFVTHREFHPDRGCITFSLSRVGIIFGKSAAKISSEWQTIFRASPCIYPEEDQYGNLSYSGRMSGGPIINYDSEQILVSVGNFHWNGFQLESFAMDTSNTFGKLILINKESGEHSIFAMGLRNTQGLFRDGENNIWATDHGPQGGDELNLIEEGQNYGWPQDTYGIYYGNRRMPHNQEQGRHSTYIKPRFAWMPSIGISKLIKLETPSKFHLWRNDILIGSMKDKSLYRVRLDKSNNVVYSERIEIGHRIRDLVVLADESLAILADGGLLIVIDDGGPVYEKIGPMVQTRIKALNRFERLINRSEPDFENSFKASGEFIFSRECSSCHNLTKANGVGPHLNNVMAREIGSVENFNYSTSLASTSTDWNPELFKDFLLRRDSRFNNTIMPKLDLSESDVDSIIHYLRMRN